MFETRMMLRNGVMTPVEIHTINDAYARTLAREGNGVWAVVFENEDGPYRIFRTRDAATARRLFAAPLNGDFEGPTTPTGEWERLYDGAPLDQWFAF